jgi:general secretion pathway protein D
MTRLLSDRVAGRKKRILFLRSEGQTDVRPCAAWLWVVFLAVGCARNPDQVPDLSLGTGRTAPPALPQAAPPNLSEGIGLTPQPVSRGFVYRGRGAYGAAARPVPGTAGAGAGAYTLNFDNADIRDVAKAVLGDMLQLGYVIAPNVQGSISLHTANPLPREAVLPAFEDALSVAGAALVPSGAGYEIVPLQGASHSGALGRTGGPGYRVEIVPLRYVAAADMQKLLEPLVASGTIVQVDTQRNLMVLGGSATELDRAAQTIALFDVDWLRSQSFGMFPLQYSQARTVASDLQAMIGQGPMAGLVRVIPIEHLNAVLVVSSRAAYVDDMRSWVERFDRGRDSGQARIFVYRVQHGRAGDLAAVLLKALGPRQAPPSEAAGAAQQAATEPAGAPGVAGFGGAPAPPAGGAGGNPLLGGLGGAVAANEDLPLGDVRITADETNNALIVVATPERYRLVEQALQQLDARPLQIMLEACVAEVDLSSDLKYGLQYYFRNGNFSLLRSGVLPASLGPDTGGLSVVFSQGNTIQAVLDLLNSVSKTKVISAPRVMVLNNRTASIDVGDQVPVPTSTAVGVVTANAPIVNTIQLIDTGIILHVTPRVGVGGSVLLDVDQEVSNPVQTTSSSINAPTIQQRKIESSISVQDGQTVAIGGLISDNRNVSRNGIPWLMDLPYVGALFSLRETQVNRTELIVLMTPRIVSDDHDADAVTDELRDKLPMIRDIPAGR